MGASGAACEARAGVSQRSAANDWRDDQLWVGASLRYLGVSDMRADYVRGFRRHGSGHAAWCASWFSLFAPREKAAQPLVCLIVLTMYIVVDTKTDRL